MSARGEGRLYHLLPAVYRIRDAEQGQPLRRLLAVMEEELQGVEDDIAGLAEPAHLDFPGDPRRPGCQFERDYLVQLLKLTDGNVSDAARLAERNRTEFYRLLSKYDLNASQFREGGTVAEERQE